MDKQVRVVLVTLGGALFALGLILGFTPITASGSDCGHVFQTARASRVNDLGNTLSGNPFTLLGDCQDARNGRSPIAWGALVMGAIIGIVPIVIGMALSPTKGGTKSTSLAKSRARERAIEEAVSLSRPPDSLEEDADGTSGP